MKNDELMESIPHHVTEVAPMPYWAELIPNTFITLSVMLILVATVVLIVKAKHKGAMVMGGSLFLYGMFTISPLLLGGGEGSTELPSREVLLMLHASKSIVVFSFAIGFYLVCREVWRSKSG